MIQQKTFQPTAQSKEAKFQPNWYIVDAKDQVVGRLATVLARVVTGKHQPHYASHLDTGDFVVVINADQVVFTRDKWKKKKYHRYTGYTGGLKTQTAEELLERKPEEILKRAVWGMTSKSALARNQLKKLKIYASDKHPHEAQNPQPLPARATRRTVLA